MKKSPIIIVGFGRSGTTWLSDIISKILGGIILFEPFHPKVYKESNLHCYSSLSNEENIKHHIEYCCNFSSKSRWLYRNHIDSSDEVRSSFIKYVSDNSNVIGFKSIRSNHMLPFLSNTFEGQTLLIHRHPFAVLSSIQNRPHFWNEFSWNWHKEVFFERTLMEIHFPINQISVLQQMRLKCTSDNEIIVLMWAISFIISLKSSRELKGHILSYEELYLDPFKEVKKILLYLNKGISKIHPSHIFTPSLTTLRTIHTLNDFDHLSRKKIDDIFWNSQMSLQDQNLLQSLLNKVLSLDQDAYERANRCGYLKS